MYPTITIIWSNRSCRDHTCSSVTHAYLHEVLSYITDVQLEQEGLRTLGDLWVTGFICVTDFNLQLGD